MIEVVVQDMLQMLKEHRGKEDHDDVDNEQERALFASLVNNLKFEMENCTKLPKEDSVNTGKQGLGFENQKDVENLFVLNKSKELAPSLYDIDKMGQDLSVDHKIISKEELESEIEKRFKHSMLNFEKQTVSKQKINRDEIFTSWSHENDVMTKVQNRLSKEFEPLARDINLQLKYFEQSLVKEMKDDLKYGMSLENEFDEKCLILDIQTKNFKTQFESSIQSYSHVYENEMFEQNSSLESENRCLKRIVTELSKQAAYVKEEMTKRCAQYEKDFAKLEARCIFVELKSQNKSSTSLQNGHVSSDKSDEAVMKFDTKDLKTINSELEHGIASLQ
ncbi:hypothetical protein Tco_1493735 [Tanacetum coccineum]